MECYLELYNTQIVALRFMIILNQIISNFQFIHNPVSVFSGFGFNWCTLGKRRVCSLALVRVGIACYLCTGGGKLVTYSLVICKKAGCAFWLPRNYLELIGEDESELHSLICKWAKWLLHYRRKVCTDGNESTERSFPWGNTTCTLCKSGSKQHSRVS